MIYRQFTTLGYYWLNVPKTLKSSNKTDDKKVLLPISCIPHIDAILCRWNYTIKFVYRFRLYSDSDEMKFEHCR